MRAVGGKRKLAPRILDCMTRPFDLYCEPFLGGGAIFLALHEAGRITEDTTVILGDANKDLIALWEAVRDNPAGTTQAANRIAYRCNGLEDYRAQRQLWNEGDRTPARQLYLRANSFNGLWRENKQGAMNADWCKELPSRQVNRALIDASSLALRYPHAELLDWGFEQYEELDLGEGALIYLDPPYLGGWSDYTAGGWSEADFAKLCRMAARWTEHGAHVVLSHSDTPASREILQSDWPKAQLAQVYARRMINRDGGGRGPVAELLATSLA